MRRNVKQRSRVSGALCGAALPLYAIFQRGKWTAKVMSKHREKSVS